MNNHPLTVNNLKPQAFNIFLNPIQSQPSQSLPVQNPSQPSQLHPNPINQINSTSLVELKIPGVRPLEMKVTVAVQPPYGNMSIEVLKKQILLDLKNMHAAIEQFNHFRNSYDLETPITNIQSAHKELSPMLFSRLKEGFKFYFPSTQQTSALQKIVEECFFKDKSAEKLLTNIMKSLCCNALCAVYLYCSVMHQHKNYPYRDLLDPQWAGPKQKVQTSPEILIKCQQFWAKDRADLANFVFQRLKSSNSSNIDIFQSKGREDYITQMMEHFELCPNELGSTYVFALEQLIITTSKIVGITQLLYRRSSSDERSNPESEINRILKKCLIYLAKLQSKHGHQGNSDKTLKKLRNILFQIKMEKLLNQIAESHEFKTKNQITSIKGVTFEQFGDFAFVFNSIFGRKQIENASYHLTELNQITNYQGLQNVQTINANPIFFNEIKHKIKIFESSLQTIPQQTANYRQNFLTFLTLYKLISKLDYSASSEENPQKSYPGADETWSSCFQKKLFPFINSETQKADRKYEMNCMFNSLLRKLFQCRKYSGPIIMLVFLQSRPTKLLQVQDDLIIQVFKHYLSLNSQALHIFNEEAYNLHKNLFQNQNLQQIIGSDQFYTKCLKSYFDKTIGLKHLEKGISTILDSKTIFVQFANHFLENESKEARKNSFESILNEVVKILYQLDQNNQDNQLIKLQDRQKLIKVLLLRQFEFMREKEELLPFYNECKKHQGSNSDLISLIKKLKKHVRQYIMKYLGYRLQKRLLQIYVNNPEIRTSSQMSQKNHIQKDYEYVCKMPDKTFTNFIKEIKQFCNCEEKWQPNKNLFQSNASSLGTVTNLSELASIEPFNDKQLYNLKSKLSYQKSLCIVFYGELLNKVWNKITPFEQLMKKSSLSLKDLYVFHENYILALDMASNFIDQALLIADDTEVDLQLYIKMTTHVNKITTHLLYILKKVSQVVEFFTQMKSMIKFKDEQIHNKIYQSQQSISNVQNNQEVTYARKKKVFNSIFTPAFLTAITKHLYIKITMFIIAIENQHFVSKSQKFKKKDVKQYVEIVSQTYDAEGLMSQTIASKLISLIGYLIETQYKIKAKQIQPLVVMAMCFITKRWQHNVPDFESLMHIVEVLNHISIGMENLIHMFAQDKDLLKMMQYARYVRNIWLQENLNNLQSEQIQAFDNELTPQQAAEFTLKYIQELTIFTAKHYTNILYPEPKAYQDFGLTKFLELKIQDVNFLLNLFNLTINILENLHLYYAKQGKDFSPLEKTQFIRLLSLNIKLIEIFYQKLLHMLTFDWDFPKYSQTTESPSKPYENVAYMVHNFKKFIQHLYCQHKENKSEYKSLENCYLYISEVMIQAHTRAGYCYWKLHMKRYLELDLVPPKMPNSEFFQLLIVDEKGLEKDKKQESSNIFKLGPKYKEQNLLAESEKYNFLFQ